MSGGTENEKKNEPDRYVAGTSLNMFPRKVARYFGEGGLLRADEMNSRLRAPTPEEAHREHRRAPDQARGRHYRPAEVFHHR